MNDVLSIDRDYRAIRAKSNIDFEVWDKPAGRFKIMTIAQMLDDNILSLLAVTMLRKGYKEKDKFRVSSKKAHADLIEGNKVYRVSNGLVYSRKR